MSLVDRGSGVPLYVQIKRILADEIVAGRSDAQAMTEQGLIERFRVSRATIRQALQELVQDGLVYRERSKGTFPVERVNIDRPATLQVGGLIGYLADQGMDPSSEVSDVHRAIPAPPVQEALALSAGETVLIFTRRIFAGARPVSLAQVQVRSPQDFLPTAAELESAGSAIALLERDYGIRAARSVHRVWASAATAAQSEALGVPEGSPILEAETTLTTREGRPVVWRHTADQADTIKLTFVSEV